MGRRWEAHWPPDVRDLIARRAADIEERHHPTVVLEGSGTFVADTASPVGGIALHPADLRRDWLPSLAPKWLAVVDGRGRVPWSFTGNADMGLLVLACARTPLAYLARLRELEVPYLLVGDDRVDLPLALVNPMTHLGTVIGRHGSIWSRYETAASK